MVSAQLEVIVAMSLGFFSGEVSSSESEDDENEAVPKSEETPNQDADEDEKLPSPDTLFATVKKPTFLNDTGQIHVDWDKYAKSIDPPTEENVHERDHYAAIPPPTSNSAELSAPPVKYSITPPPSSPNEDGVERDELSAGKRPSLEADSASNKKQKVETFRQKEKKKRDLGMSSRGKNYVEEEKRVLREQYGPLGVGD